MVEAPVLFPGVSETPKTRPLDELADFSYSKFSSGSEQPASRR